MPNNQEINYKKLAKAVAEYPDDESDRIIARWPGHLKQHFDKDIPARGELPGAERLAKVNELSMRVENKLKADASDRAAKDWATITRRQPK